MIYRSHGIKMETKLNKNRKGLFCNVKEATQLLIRTRPDKEFPEQVKFLKKIVKIKKLSIESFFCKMVLVTFYIQQNFLIFLNLKKSFT